MNQNNIQPDISPTTTGFVWTDLTPPLTVHTHSQPSVTSTQTGSLHSSDSSISFGSTSPEDRRADKVFDKIEDLLCEMMRDPVQHHLHCRVLRWGLEEDPSKVFTAVVIVNPPTNNP